MKENEQTQEQQQNQQQPAKGKKSTTKKVLKYGTAALVIGGAGYLAGNKEARGKVLDAGKSVWGWIKDKTSSKSNDNCPEVDDEIVEEAVSNNRDVRNNDRQWRNGGNNGHRDFNNNRK